MEFPKPHSAKGLLFSLLLLAGSLLSPAAPIISEILADNESGQRDEDGDWEDWLELYNPDPDPVDLGGYFLTDRPENLPKWRIPDNTVLQQGQFLLLFASGKDRAVAGQQLHTSFKLENNGEYLALVGPDGVAIIHEFSPTYPVQFNDASYGVEQEPVTAEDILVDVDAACSTHVAPDNNLGISWTQITFNDNLWTAGFLGAGYDRGIGYGDLINADLEQVVFIDSGKEPSTAVHGDRLTFLPTER